MINIIIPAYNSSKTLARALASIEAQTIKKAIVTIVDDCSTEDYSDIINHSSLSISWLKTEKNSGAGVARQVGIDNCNCDYLMFMDADDVLSPLAITYISSEVYRTRPDILCTKFYEESSFKIFEKGFDQIWLHGKVFKTSFLKENNIRFHETLRYNEDGAFCGLAFNIAKKVERKDFVTYIWCNNSSSTVRGQYKDYYGECARDFVVGRAYIYSELVKRNLNDKLFDSITNSLAIIYFMYLDINEYSKNNTVPFNEEVKKYLQQIDFNKLIRNESFLHDLSISYWETMKRPYYGPLIPLISLYDYYSSLLDEK